MEAKVILSRRKAITSMFVLMAGATVSCAPVRLAMDLKKEDVPGDLDEVKHTLTSFVNAVIPGMDHNHPGIAEIFFDRFYRIHKYTCAFARDLNNRSEKMFNQVFYKLTLPDKTRVIEDGLNSNVIAGQLYSGAVFFSQIAVYSGLANNDQGCALIDFKGTYEYRPNYSNPDDMLGLPATKTGNPA